MEDTLTELIPPDVLVSYSFWDNFCRKSPLYPEQALMLAVLEDAIRCIQNNARASNSKVRRETVEWMLEKNSDYVFSFENICGILGLDADYVRKGVLTWQRHGAAKLRQPGGDSQKKVSRGTRVPQPSP